MSHTEEEPIKTYLGEKGYTIIKEYIDEKEQEWIREKLTPKPYIPGSPIQPASFKVYQESIKKLYIPRCFGIQNYGIPDECKIPKGDTINLSFNGDLRDYQKNIVSTYLNSTKYDFENKSPVGLLEIPCGRGKCLGKDTPILMYDSTIKKVQNVKVGDKIMGDDSTPRIVKTLARGRETMYKIHTDSGHYIVNESHILSLKTSNNDVVDISLMDYLSNNHIYKEKLYGYRVPIEFSNDDEEVPKPEKAYAHGWNRSVFDKSLTAHHLSAKEEYNVIKKQYIKTNRNTRLHLIAGILESNHFTHHKNIQRENYFSHVIDEPLNNYIENYLNIINISNQFAEDILFIVRSLGWGGVKTKMFSPYVTDKCSNNDLLREMDTLYKVELYFPSYEEIYAIPFRKKNISKEWVHTVAKYKIRRDLLLYDINVERLDEDEYYGFEIDGNRRFVLGDLTVTHNTVIALNIISKLQTKTLVVVHKGFLLNQWVERIQQFLPGARIGKIQGQIIDIDNKDIVIGMIQSLSMKEYPQKMFSSFGLTIVDECHHISSEVFSRTLQKIVTRCMLGLSATMERKDGLTPVFKMFLGDIVYSEKREEEDPVLVKGIEYKSNNDEVFDETLYDYRGNPAFSSMITKICSYSHRTEFILKVLKKELEIKPDQQIMILAHNRNLLTYLYQAIETRGIATVGYYVGGMKEVDLKKSETKKVIVATYSMAAEGLDIKTLSTLILATPKTDVVQAVGRILRVKHERPLIVDIVDSHDMFKKQWYKRRAFYLKCKYRVMYTNNEGYLVDKWHETKEQRKKKCDAKSSASATSCAGRKVTKYDGLLNDDAFDEEDGDGYLDFEDKYEEEEENFTQKSKTKKFSLGKCMVDLS
jgi:superfamily II DNA or RNA helicase